jgi:hypothetical protein
MKMKDLVEEVLQKEGYRSTDDFMKDWAFFLALSKQDQYRAEIDFFEKKYCMKFMEFDSLLHGEKGKEDFQKEEDAEDWEFSLNALRWWEEKIREIENAQGS